MRGSRNDRHAVLSRFRSVNRVIFDLCSLPLCQRPPSDPYREPPLFVPCTRTRVFIDFCACINIFGYLFLHLYMYLYLVSDSCEFLYISLSLEYVRLYFLSLFSSHVETQFAKLGYVYLRNILYICINCTQSNFA